MKKSAPNSLIPSAVIAGITIGFLATAYKFIFSKSDKPLSNEATTVQQTEQQVKEEKSASILSR